MLGLELSQDKKNGVHIHRLDLYVARETESRALGCCLAAAHMPVLQVMESV